MTALRRFLAPLFMLVLVAASAGAQRAGVVTGIVRDSATARPLVGAAVMLNVANEELTTRTDERGEFRFRDVIPRRYLVTVRRIGYEPWTSTIEIGEKHPPIEVALAPVSALDTVRVRAEAGMGIFGIVGSMRELRPLPGAEVQVVGSSSKLTTDSSGRFFASLRRPGVYVVRARLPGYEAQMVSLTVSKDVAAEVVILLDTSNAKPSNRAEIAWLEFGERQKWRGTRSALVSRAELLRNGDANLMNALRFAPSLLHSSLRFGPTACVFVDGMVAATKPVWSFDAEDVEAVEVYAGDAVSEATGSLGRSTSPGLCLPTGEPPTSGSRRQFIQYVVVWLKR